MAQDVIRCTKEEADAVRETRVKYLRASKRFLSVNVDSDGRIVVVVDDDGVENPALFRKTWGEEWPTVRSSKFNEREKAADQFLFRSRGC